MNDANWSKVTGTKINRAARRREEQAERAHLIAALGWAPENPTEGPGGRYCATTGELRQMVK